MMNPRSPVDPDRAALVRVVGRYRRAVKSLEKLKAKLFYHGTPVWVNDARYTGPGVAVTDGECWPDHVAVSLPNGNTWRYPVTSVWPGTKPETNRRWTPMDADETQSSKLKAETEGAA